MEKTIKQLRREGWKVKVNHYRFVKEKESNIMWAPYKVRELGLTFDPRGGSTIIEIESPDGRTSHGASLCSRNDNFNRRIGVRIALGRALDQMESAG